MDEDSATVIVLLAMILPAGLAASLLAPAPSFLFGALWFSFVWLFWLVTVELGMVVGYARRGVKLDRQLVSRLVLGPVVLGTWALSAFVVRMVPLNLLVGLAAWFAYIFASGLVGLKWGNRMERLHPGGKRRLSARLQRKLGAKTR